MIKFILNGYYRSGTTFLWQVMKSSNPEMIHLYEPLHPDAPRNVFEKIGVIDPLHGVSLWDDYQLLPKKILDEMIRNHRNFTFVTNADDVFAYLDPLARTKKGITLQPNRASIVLPELSKRYNCKYAHLIRNIYDTWLSFIRQLYFDGWKSLYRRHVLSLTPGNMFYLNETYESLRKWKQGIPEVNEKDYIGKFVVNWTYINYETISNLNDKGMVFWFDNVKKDEYLKRLEKHSGLRFDISKVSFNSKRASHKNKKRIREKITREIDKKVEELGLGKVIKKINKTK